MSSACWINLSEFQSFTFSYRGKNGRARLTSFRYRFVIWCLTQKSQLANSLPTVVLKRFQYRINKHLSKNHYRTFTYWWHESKKKNIVGGGWKRTNLHSLYYKLMISRRRRRQFGQILTPLLRDSLPLLFNFVNQTQKMNGMDWMNGLLLHRV